ncbi:MAG: DUF2723 domain-containing protein [Anaerolineae bacterium]|nr:DUF2723 domain-containing protein [Anaerolineae bacterium]
MARASPRRESTQIRGRRMRLGGALAGQICWTVILGLFSSRLIAETSLEPWRLCELLPLFAGSLLASWCALHAVGARVRRLWPLALLGPYILWPVANPSLACGLLITCLVSLWVMNAHPWVCSALVEGVVFLLALGLYVFTLSPTLLPADAGEFQLVAGVLGVAHPPGYALYTMVGRLFSLLPIGDVAYRLNLFGAVCAALTLAVLSRTVRQATGSAGAAVVSAGLLGLSSTFWAQGTTANIRSLTALFAGLCLLTAIRWRQSQTPGRLAALGLCFGLGVGHHASLGLLAPAFLLYLLSVRPRLPLEPKCWLPGLAVFLLSFSVLLYLPLRSRMGAPFDPAPIRSCGDFARHVLASGFQGDMLHYRTWPVLWARLSVWAQIMRLQFGPVLPWVALAALAPLAIKRWRLALLLGGIWALNTLAAVTYRAPQTVEYLIPSYVALAAMLGCGLGLLTRYWRPHRALYAGLVALILLSIALYAGPNYASYTALHEDRSAREYAEDILRQAPEGAVILSSWHRATSFWYLQQVEGLRPDVAVRYVYPEGDTPNAAIWLRRIGDELAERPVIVTNRFHAYDMTAYRWTPLAGAWLVHAGPLFEPPLEITPRGAVYEEQIELLGYALEHQNVTPGQALGLQVYWRPLVSLGRDYSSFVQIVGSQGVIGQGDIVHSSRQYLPGEIRVDAYQLPVLLHAAPQECELITGFYSAVDGGWTRLTAGGQDHVRLGSIRISPLERPLASLHPADVAFCGGLHLVGWDVDRSIADQTRLYLHWWRPSRGLALGPWRTQALEGLTLTLSAGGQVVAQAPIAPPPPGHGLITALDIPNALARDPIALSIADQGGQSVSRLGPWHQLQKAGLTLSLPRGARRYVPLGGMIAFTGLEGAARIVMGDVGRLTPTWLALRPLVDDYSVSLGLLNRPAGWEVKSDGTPALGAIPTLKWVKGWRVEDPRRIAPPSVGPAGEAEIIVDVYDAFTLEPLAVLDERLVRQGQGVTLGVGAVQVVAE